MSSLVMHDLRFAFICPFSAGTFSGSGQSIARGKPMAQQTFDAVPVLSELIARQLTALLRRHVDDDRVKQQVESLGLPRNATLPDVCLAWNRGQLGVPVQGVTSETKASCRLELSFVDTYDEAVEAANWHRLLVSLDGGIPALGRSLPNQQCISCLSWGHGHGVLQETPLYTEKNWDQKVDNAWTAKVILTGRDSNELPLPDDVYMEHGPLHQGEHTISNTIPMASSVHPNVDARNQKSNAIQEVISTKRALAAVRETWRGNDSDADRTKAKRLEDTVEHILTGDGAEINIIVLDSDANKEDRTRLSSILSPAGKDVFQNTRRALREAFGEGRGDAAVEGLDVLTENFLTAALVSKGQRWEYKAVRKLQDMLRKELQTLLDGIEGVLRQHFDKLMHQINQLDQLIGQPKGFFVLSPNGRLHMVGVTPCETTTGCSAADARKATEELIKKPARWNVIHKGPLSCNFYFRRGDTIVSYQVETGLGDGDQAGNLVDKHNDNYTRTSVLY
eukprot:3782516-Amphidinium_carterae.1